MKQKTQLHHRKSRKFIAGFFVALALVVTLGMSGVPHRLVGAESASDEITRLQQENTANQNNISRLKNEAVSYQDALSRLRSQAAILQGQINDSVARQNDLQAKIVANQLELDRQRSVLGINIRTMYLEGQISTIEMLATSKNLSDFVDKEEYRTAVKNKIQETLKKIAVLQNELNAQKAQVDALLKEQQTQQVALDAAKAEQASMLNYNQAQQSAYNKKTKANQMRIDRLIEEQRRLLGGDTKGGYYFLRFPGAVRDFNPADYPYANAGFSMSTAPGCNDNDGPDKWGYCTRQCVSYAAWAVEASGRDAPMYYSDAKKWVSAANRKAVPVYADPRPGDVAIYTGGHWGHAMYVEAVDGDQIYVSQYNANLTGRFSTQWKTFR